MRQAGTDYRIVKAGVFAVSVGLVSLCLSAGCSNQDATRPVKITALDKALLVEIAHKAISERLPAVPLENLEQRSLIYTCYRDRIFSRTNELFEVRFRIRNSKREVERNGETAFEADEISVAIEPDGKIGSEGVRKIVASYAMPDLGPLSGEGSSSVPVPGVPFYPVTKGRPLPKPDCEQVEGVAVRAIAKFLPTMDIRGLQLDQLSFFDVMNPDSRLADSCYLVTYWNANSLRMVTTAAKVVIDGEQITVRVAVNGQVHRDGVSAQPLHFTCSRAMLEEWRHNEARSPARAKNQPDLTSSPAP